MTKSSYSLRIHKKRRSADKMMFKAINNCSSLDQSLLEYENGNYQSFNSVDELFDDIDDKENNY